MLDDRTAERKELDGAGHFVWNNRLNRFGWRSYLGIEPSASSPRHRALGIEPSASSPRHRALGIEPSATSIPIYAVPARREDVRGLPTAWIGVGDIELFDDEDRAYAQRLRAAGVEATLEVVPGAPHGFEAWASNTAQARDYVARAQAWLRQAVAAYEGGAAAPA